MCVVFNSFSCACLVLSSFHIKSYGSSVSFLQILHFVLEVGNSSCPLLFPKTAGFILWVQLNFGICLISIEDVGSSCLSLQPTLIPFVLFFFFPLFFYGVKSVFLVMPKSKFFFSQLTFVFLLLHRLRFLDLYLKLMILPAPFQRLVSMNFGGFFA